MSIAEGEESGEKEQGRRTRESVEEVLGEHLHLDDVAGE